MSSLTEEKEMKVIITALCLTALAAAGCGSSTYYVTFSEGYKARPGMTIEVGTVTNETGEVFETDVESILALALKDEIAKKHLLYVGGDVEKLVLITRIVEYEKGSTWRRWLWPGSGTTTLAIRCDLKEGDRPVGSVQARRSIEFELATIEVWEDIFTRLAEDVAKDLEKTMENESD